MPKYEDAWCDIAVLAQNCPHVIYVPLLRRDCFINVSDSICPIMKGHSALVSVVSESRIGSSTLIESRSLEKMYASNTAEPVFEQKNSKYQKSYPVLNNGTVGGYQKNPESLENRRPSPRISPVQTSRR
jgi:hypothetical protein